MWAWIREMSAGVIVLAIVSLILLIFIIFKSVEIIIVKRKKNQSEQEFNKIKESVSGSIKEYIENKESGKKPAADPERVLIENHVDFTHVKGNPYLTHFTDNIKGLQIEKTKNYGYYLLLFKFYDEFKVRIMKKGFIDMVTKELEDVDETANSDKFHKTLTEAKKVFENSKSAYECDYGELRSLLNFLKGDFYIALIHYDKKKAKELGLADFYN